MNQEKAETLAQFLNENREVEEGTEFVAVYVEAGREFGFDEWTYAVTAKT